MNRIKKVLFKIFSSSSDKELMSKKNGKAYTWSTASTTKRISVYDQITDIETVYVDGIVTEKFKRNN